MIPRHSADIGQPEDGIWNGRRDRGIGASTRPAATQETTLNGLSCTNPILPASPVAALSVDARSTEYIPDGVQHRSESASILAVPADPTVAIKATAPGAGSWTRP